MPLLTKFKKYIGCEDCGEQWAIYCPLCKEKGKKLKTLDGKSQKMTHYRFWDKRGNTYLYYKIKDFPSSKQNEFNYPELNNPSKKAEKEYWSQFHPKNVVRLILIGHDAACKCCCAIDKLTFDHIIPISKDGPNTLENGQILCLECNRLKDDNIMTIDELKSLCNVNKYQNK